MKQLLFLIFFSISSFLFSQKSAKEIFFYEKKLVDSVSNKFDLKNPDFKPLKELANNYKFQSCQSHSYAYRSVAYYYSKLYLDGVRFKLKQEYLELIIDSTLQYYELSKNICRECFNSATSEKLDFLAMTNHNDLYNKELEMMKKMGYRKDDKGLSLGIVSQFGKNSWLGFSMSAFEVYLHSNIKFKGYTTSFFQDWWSQAKFSVFNFEYLFNLNRKQNDISFSLLKLSVPIHLDFTKFGFMKSDRLNTVYGYYRPEFGFGYKYVSFGYSYNLIFRKSARSEFENHLFFVKLTYPILK